MIVQTAFCDFLTPFFHVNGRILRELPSPGLLLFVLSEDDPVHVMKRQLTLVC